MHKTGWKTLGSTCKQRVLSTVHKCCYGEAPDQLCQNIITKKENNLRERGKLVIPRPETNFLHKSITFRGALLWNKLPTNLKNEELHNFKMLIRQKDLEAMDFTSHTNKNDLNHIYIFLNFSGHILIYIFSLLLLLRYLIIFNYDIYLYILT